MSSVISWVTISPGFLLARGGLQPHRALCPPVLLRPAAVFLALYAQHQPLCGLLWDLCLASGSLNIFQRHARRQPCFWRCARSTSPSADYYEICVWHLAPSTYSNGTPAGIRVFGAVHTASCPLRIIMGSVFGIWVPPHILVARPRASVFLALCAQHHPLCGLDATPRLPATWRPLDERGRGHQGKAFAPVPV